MSEQSGRSDNPRMARLRPEYAHLYSGVAPEVWLRASVMVDRVLVLQRRISQPIVPLRDRPLASGHFEFRDGAGKRGGNPHPRGRSSDRGELFG